MQSKASLANLIASDYKSHDENTLSALTMFKFFLYFSTVQLCLFSLEKLNSTRELVIIPFTEKLAQISTWLIQIFDDQVISNGIILQHLENGFSVSIESGCNGVEALMILASAMLVFPAPWLFKLQGIIIGFIAVELLNIVRIISLFYLGQWSLVAFEWAHLYIWEALIMLDVLIIFLCWLKFLPDTPERVTEKHAD